jgi:carboxynorspermidine decarboxylase
VGKLHNNLHTLPIDYSQIPSPCYVIEEERFRSNLFLIKRVSEQSGAEIILAFKGFAMWGVFNILKEYIKGASASSLHEARLCFEEIHIHRSIKRLILNQF